MIVNLAKLNPGLLFKKLIIFRIDLCQKENLFFHLSNIVIFASDENKEHNIHYSPGGLFNRFGTQYCSAPSSF